MTGPREVDAFLEVLDATPPNAVTACPGWTAHELIAHLVSGVEAIADQSEAHLERRPIPAYGSFAEREVGFWPIADDALRRRLLDGERRMTAALEHLVSADPTGAVPGVGWGMPLRDVILHMRQEFAVHRWDLVGDDEAGDEILARPELIDHAVRILADPLLAVGRSRDPRRDEALTVRVRAADLPDLLVDIGPGATSLALVEQADHTPDIECDPAARFLLLWGRRPLVAGRVRSSLGAADLARLRALLSGF